MVDLFNSDEEWIPPPQPNYSDNNGSVYRIPLFERTGPMPTDIIGRPILVSKFFGEIEIGTPPQKINTSFDTGSANILVPSQFCTNTSCVNRTLFFHENSSTKKDLMFPDLPDMAHFNESNREKVTIVFGTGEVVGHFMLDQVCLAEGLCNRTGVIAAVQRSDEPFIHLPFDGITGLALPKMAEAPAFSILDVFWKAGLIKNQIFGAAMQAGNNPEITFGGYDSDRFEGDLVWSNLSSPHYWQVQVRFS